MWILTILYTLLILKQCIFNPTEKKNGGAQVSIGGIETVVEFWIPEEVTHDQPEPEPATEEEEDDVSTNEKETENEEYEDEESTEPSLGGTEENEQDEDNDSDEEDEEPEEPKEDPEETYEDDSLKSAPETSTKSRTRSEEGTIGGLEQGHPKEPEDNDLGEEDEDEAEESENSSSSPVSMDIADLDSQNYKHVDYIYDDNHIRLFLPNEGMIIAKLIDGEHSIWKAKSDEKFDHAKVYLNKDGKPELVLVVTKRADTSKETYLELKDGKWVSCDDHDAKMRSLRDPADYISNFELDLALANSTDQCTVFEAELLGVTTKHFFPKAGFHAKKVTDGSSELWEPTKPILSNISGIQGRWNGYYKRWVFCLSCLIYKHGDKELLEMIVVENDSVGKKYFEKADGKWVEIKKEDFNNKLKHMKSESEEASSHPSTIPS